MTYLFYCFNRYHKYVASSCLPLESNFWIKCIETSYRKCLFSQKADRPKYHTTRLCKYYSSSKRSTTDNSDDDICANINQPQDSSTLMLVNHSKYVRPNILSFSQKLYQEHCDLLKNLSESANPLNQPKENQLIRIAEIEPIANLFKDWSNNDKTLSDLYAMKQNSDLKDKEFLSLIMKEIADTIYQLTNIEESIRNYFLPNDIADQGDAIVEVRAGTGGMESYIFTYDIWLMYQKYVEKKSWSWEPISCDFVDVNRKGVREAIACVRGFNAYGHLKFESGVHRVQRVPETEASGRVHTSTMTVAILPVPEKVEFDLNDKDLKVDVFRSSGAGGQHVNTTNSAVRITHLPSGIAVVVQEERSQLQNRIKAISVLKSRLYQKKREDCLKNRQQSRKEQIGTGDRHEKIRTYNYPQGRITDHRIGFTIHHLEDFMTGNIDPLVSALLTNSEAEALIEFEKKIHSTHSS